VRSREDELMDELRNAKGGTYAFRRGVPLGRDYFELPRPAAGPRSVGIAFDTLRLRIDGLDDALADALLDRYGPYAEASPGIELEALVVKLAREERDYFIAPPTVAEFNPVWLAVEGSRICFLGYRLAGWFDVSRSRGEILLARGAYEPELRALENYIRCAVAWCAAERGGALVHSASIVRHGKAYLFYGESGAGKSTLSAVNTRGRVVSDDLSLVLPRPGGGLDLVGSPFRGTYEDGEPVVGRFPLAAGFRIVKGDKAEVRAAPRALAFGQLVGNLTFVAEAFKERPDLFASIEAAFTGVPLLHLHFKKDDSYWDAIDAAGL
jgi:hypothetical protein